MLPVVVITGKLEVEEHAQEASTHYNQSNLGKSPVQHPIVHHLNTSPLSLASLPPVRPAGYVSG